MATLLAFEEALRLGTRALEAYRRVETKAEVEEIFVRYGKNGIGYRPLCRILFSKMPVEKAVKAYRTEEPKGQLDRGE